MYLSSLPIIEVFIKSLKTIKEPTALVTYNCSSQDMKRLRDSLGNLYHINIRKDKINIDYRKVAIMLIPYDYNIFGWYIMSEHDLKSEYFDIKDVKNIYYIGKNKMIDYTELEMLIWDFNRGRVRI